MATANLSQEFPIYDITNKGIIIGDNKASITIAFKMSLPTIYTLSKGEYMEMIEAMRTFQEMLGEDILVHKQGFFFREYFSFSTDDSSIYESDFIESAYQRHFNERPYMSSDWYLYVSKINATETPTSNLISKSLAETNEDTFINNILSASSILERFGVKLEQLTKEELIGEDSPIIKYLNFSNSGIEEMKDIDFSDNKVYSGKTEINIFSIQSLEQFPTTNIKYSKVNNGLPISNMADFGHKLKVPHIINEYIYTPNQKDLMKEIERKQSLYTSYNYGGSNESSLTDIVLFKQKREELNTQGVYYHCNIMCFDETSKVIDNEINNAFADSGFKKNEPTISRKDLFWSGVAGNGSNLINQKKYLMALLIDLEACAFLNYEQNYNDNITSTKGVKLCDRVYGIPITVDLFDEPKKRGLIKNQNMIVLAGSGGGKSYTVNLILLNLYRQGAHVFIIDASFSYRLQTKMHDGVYLTFDKKNKISFNPFYLDWMKNDDAILLFTEPHSIKNNTNLMEYSDLLESKINLIIGVLGSMTKGEDESSTRFEETVYRNLLHSYFKEKTISKSVDDACFDDFYNFTKEFLPKYLKEANIPLSDFNYNKFLLMLVPFTSGQSLGYLLNSTDEKIKNLDKERFVVIDVSGIRQNKLLFSIISALAMDLYNQKIAKLPIGVKKILGVDEAWQAIVSPEMSMFMKTQVKVIRKYGGQTIFISQELDDFISSDILQESVINNSAVKLFADMGEFKQKFEPIKKTMTISDATEEKIKSINQNRRNSTYKEVCICWEQYSQVYAVETPLELKAIFETDADEVAKILPQYEKYGVELASINYAQAEQ